MKTNQNAQQLTFLHEKMNNSLYSSEHNMARLEKCVA